MTFDMLIDNERTTLTFVHESESRGFVYHTPGNTSAHAFKDALRAGQSFRTNGHSYRVIGYVPSPFTRTR